MPRPMKFASALSVITFMLTAGAASAGPLKIVASFSVIGDLARNVGGDRVEITTLVGPNGDAHVYEPKPADAAAMAQADVLLVNGFHFEGFLDRLVETSSTRARIATLSDGVVPLHMSDEPHAHEEAAGDDHDAIDPHAFQSIANAEIYVANIATAFCTADAAGCEAYRANAASYTKTLDALETEVKAAVASIPPEKRVVITSHDAFGYFEHAYGIAFLAPEGISTDSEASAADVAKLIEQVRHDKAAAIFVENITNKRLVEQIASETGIKVGGTLYSDALSDPAEPAATYIDMMRHNIATIKGAVLGS